MVHELSQSSLQLLGPSCLNHFVHYCLLLVSLFPRDSSQANSSANGGALCPLVRGPCAHDIFAHVSGQNCHARVLSRHDYVRSSLLTYYPRITIHCARQFCPPADKERATTTPGRLPVFRCVYPPLLAYMKAVREAKKLGHPCSNPQVVKDYQSQSVSVSVYS